MAAEREAVQLAADVIREAVTCDRSQCTPEDHHRYVTENMRIAADRINVARPSV